MLYRFTYITGENANHVETLESTPIMLGRDDACQIRFDKWKELSVSGQHARIEEISEGTWQIENLSKNGVMVNGVPCDGTTKLPNHATIQLGKDGPRVRFDVDQNVGGISKADVQRRKEQKKQKQKTGRMTESEADRARGPDTEERPVFQIKESGSPEGGKNKVIAIAAIGAGIAVLLLGAVWKFFL